jgi:hypothetical protein
LNEHFNFIDYSQWGAWWRCRWYWYERYVNQRQRRVEGQRDDALTFGGMVHDGLRHWAESRLPAISKETVEELNPTPECFAQAQELVQEYVRRYPNEEWEMTRVEEPLTFGLGLAFQDQWGELFNFHTIPPPAVGLAKIDAYFYNPTQRDVESGLTDYTLSLQPGWWIREYKTKDAGRNRANWMRRWETNMQASFQMLALQEKIGEPVQGTLVCVLEKPKMYVPKRKCKGCQELYEMASYLPTGDGQHACPMCGHTQKLKPYESKTQHRPEFYRMKALRTQEELARDRGRIGEVALAMERMRQEGLESTSPNTEACVHDWFGSCEYYNPHIRGFDSAEEPTLEERDARKYVELERLIAN